MAATADVLHERGDAASRPTPLRRMGLAIILLAVVMGGASFFVLMGLTPLQPTPGITTAALIVNLGFVLLLGGLVAVDARRLYLAWRRGRVGARLHAQIVGLFSVIALVPAIVVALVASLTLDQGLDRWFSDRVRTIVGESTAVARAYYAEHAGTLRGELVAMSVDLNRQADLYQSDRDAFQRLLTTQSVLRSLPATFIVREDGALVMRSGINTTREFPGPPPAAIEQATAEAPFIITPGNTDLVGSIIELTGIPGHYLYVVRPVDSRVLDHLRRAEQGTAEYAVLERERLGFQVAFALLYVSLALIVLAAAIWFGFAFANQIVSPVRRLGAAADAISKGDFDVRVPVSKNQGDLSQLANTFNTMVADLQAQRTQLLDANATSDRRRRFTETVLSGVTAGVIGVNKKNEITLANRPVLETFSLAPSDILGRPLGDVMPELKPLVADALRKRSRVVQGQITVARRGRDRTLNVRVAREKGAAGAVVTLDDITDLVAAQRTSAWADVARRIAHEIKNPLTPIRLSAERLRRKYGKVIVEDRDVFEQCTQTIVRQVEDIGRMVDEFASFARMPTAEPEDGDLAETVRQATFLQRMANTDLSYDIDVPDGVVPARIDRRLITQALTNIVKNAGEAVRAKRDEGGAISVRLTADGAEHHVTIADNGPGFPREGRNKLLEPYVTTRSEGTGLGLAIVKKIMDDHGGRIELGDAPDLGGALVRLVFPTTDPMTEPTTEPGPGDAARPTDGNEDDVNVGDTAQPAPPGSETEV